MDLSRERKLDTDSKGVNSGGTQSVFVLTFLGKIKETRPKFFQVSVRVKLTKNQLKKIQSATKVKIGTTLRITKNSFKMKNFIKYHF